MMGRGSIVNRVTVVFYAIGFVLLLSAAKLWIDNSTDGAMNGSSVEQKVEPFLELRESFDIFEFIVLIFFLNLFLDLKITLLTLNNRVYLKAFDKLLGEQLPELREHFR